MKKVVKSKNCQNKRKQLAESNIRNVFPEPIEGYYGGYDEMVSFLEIHLICMSSHKEYVVVVKSNTRYEYLSDNKVVIPYNCPFGIKCLTAVANDIKKLYENNMEYWVERFIRYDDIFVNSYATPEHIKEEKKNKSSQGILHEEDLILLESPMRKQKYNYKNGVKVRVYVLDNFCNRCLRQRHPIETVTMVTANNYGVGEIEVNVYYCKSCDKYFVNHEIIKDWHRHGKAPYLNFETDKTYEERREASLLTMFGYNVQEGILTESEREHLLGTLIDNNDIPKFKIINILEENINYNGKKRGMENAVIKWEHDIRFVSKYGTKGQRRIHGIITQ